MWRGRGVSEPSVRPSSGRREGGTQLGHLRGCVQKLLELPAVNRDFHFYKTCILHPLLCAPWYIQQGCCMKTSGLRDIFSFIFYQAILSIWWVRGPLNSHRYIAPFWQIHCTILVVSDLAQIIRWKTTHVSSLCTSFLWLQDSLALIY